LNGALTFFDALSSLSRTEDPLSSPLSVDFNDSAPSLQMLSLLCVPTTELISSGFFIEMFFVCCSLDFFVSNDSSPATLFGEPLSFTPSTFADLSSPTGKWLPLFFFPSIGGASFPLPLNENGALFLALKIPSKLFVPPLNESGVFFENDPSLSSFGGRKIPPLDFKPPTRSPFFASSVVFTSGNDTLPTPSTAPAPCCLSFGLASVGGKMLPLVFKPPTTLGFGPSIFIAPFNTFFGALNGSPSFSPLPTIAVSLSFTRSSFNEGISAGFPVEVGCSLDSFVTNDSSSATSFGEPLSSTSSTFDDLFSPTGKWLPLIFFPSIGNATFPLPLNENGALFLALKVPSKLFVPPLNESGVFFVNDPSLSSFGGRKVPPLDFKPTTRLGFGPSIFIAPFNILFGILIGSPFFSPLSTMAVSLSFRPPSFKEFSLDFIASKPTTGPSSFFSSPFILFGRPPPSIGIDSGTDFASADGGSDDGFGIEV